MKTIAKPLWLEALVLLLIIATMSGIYFVAGEKHVLAPSLPVSEFQKVVQAESPVLIDLRESQEILVQPFPHQPMLHLPFSFLRAKRFELVLSSNRRFIFICNDGNRSRLVASLLAEKGIRVAYLEKGIWSLPDF